MKKLLLIILLLASTFAAQAQFLLPGPIDPVEQTEFPQLEPIYLVSITHTQFITRETWGGVLLHWEGAIPPFKIQATRGELSKAWVDITPHIYGYTALLPNEGSNVFFRVRTVLDTTPPPPLDRFEARVLPPGVVKLEWGDIPADPFEFDEPRPGGTGLGGVRVFRDGKFMCDVPYPAPEFVDTNIVQGRVYTYAAAAVDRALNQSLFIGARTAVVPNYSVTLAWEASTLTDLAGYALRWGNRAGVYLESVDVGDVLSYIFGILDPYQTYYFVLNAYNSLGIFGPDSNEISYRVVFP